MHPISYTESFKQGFTALDHGSRIVDGSTLVSNSFQQQSELLILKYLYTFTKNRGRMHS